MDADTAAALDHLVELAMHEDVRDGVDCTSLAVVPDSVAGQASFVSRESGIVCGMAVCQRVLMHSPTGLDLEIHQNDGDRVNPGDSIATLQGDARQILRLERVCLNFMGRLSGIATLTRKFVDAVKGTKAQIHDTRKTTPGWRLIEKYAVRCGGGTNHRLGLYDAILIKDNHLAMLARLVPSGTNVVAESVRLTRQWIDNNHERLPNGRKTWVQIEVDSLDQLRSALELKPDMILLDNMSLEDLRAGVEIRNDLASTIQLEASGGVNLKTVGAIARTGVDRISVGALTHSATNFDIGLDWQLDG